MRNNYEAPEVIELEKAHDAIRSQKIAEPNPPDNFGIPDYTIHEVFDDFDE